MNIVKKTITMGDGTIIEIETGKLAKQAAGSVVVKVGGTMLLATVTCAKDAKEDVDFMPLSVEYKENMLLQAAIPADSSRGRAALRIRKSWWPDWWTGLCVPSSRMISMPRCL